VMIWRSGKDQIENSLIKLSEIFHENYPSEKWNSQKCWIKRILKKEEISSVCNFKLWRLQVSASSYNSNKLINKMQQFYKFITWGFVSLNMFRAPPHPSSGAYNCINSLWFYIRAWW
jgi:hypothetical protein